MFEKTDKVIVYTICSRLFEMLLTSVESVAKNNSNICFCFLQSQDSFTDDQKRRLKDTVCRNIDSNNKILIIDVLKWCDVFDSLICIRGQFISYTKLFIPILLKKLKIRKCLYLDEDTYCNGDISKLYSIESSNKVFLGFGERGPVIDANTMLKKRFICSGLMMIFDNHYDLERLAKVINYARFRYIRKLRNRRDQYIIASLDQYNFIPFRKNLNRDMKKLKEYIDWNYRWGIFGIYQLRDYNIFHYAKTYRIEDIDELLKIVA